MSGVKPIIFCAPMVRALLDGSKTQTRRPVVPQPTDDRIGGAALVPGPDGLRWCWLSGYDGSPVAPIDEAPFAVGDLLWVKEAWAIDGWWNKQPPSTMPRWASRLTLRITEVRPQRLQEITPADALAEGIASLSFWQLDRFRELWDSLYAETYPWKGNPWVWALTFEVIKANVDSVLEAAA